MFRVRRAAGFFAVVATAWLSGCCPGGGDRADEEAPSVTVQPRSAAWVKVGAGSELSARVRSEVAKARAGRLKPIVYVGASWCEPCRAIHAYQRDPKMVEAFAGTYVIELDADEWEASELDALGYEAGTIPVFLVVGDDGRAKGPKIDGGAWGENIPGNMAPPLKRFFEGIS